MSTEVTQFIGDLDGGVLEEKLGRILSEVAGAVMDQGRKGQVALTIDVSKASDAQVLLSHKLAYKRPTMKGTVAEDDTTSTPMHVGKGGAMTFFPEARANQDNLLGVE